MSTWQDVATAVTQRRHHLGLTQAEAVARSSGLISLPVWSHIENARQTDYRARSLVGVARALDWPPDAITQILNGTDPADLPHTPAPPTADDLTSASRAARADDPLDLFALGGQQLEGEARQRAERFIQAMLDEQGLDPKE